MTRWIVFSLGLLTTAAASIWAWRSGAWGSFVWTFFPSCILAGIGLCVTFVSVMLLIDRRRERRDNPLMVLTVTAGFMRTDVGKTIEVQGRTYTIAEVDNMGLARIVLVKRPWWKFWRRK